MKKIIKYLMISLTILISGGVLYLHFAPVDFDAAACSGGYKKWVADTHTLDLVHTFIASQGYEEDIKYNVISSAEDIASEVSWNGRDINAKVKIEIDDKAYDVKFKGKRYWVEKYKWEVEDIN